MTIPNVNIPVSKSTSIPMPLGNHVARIYKIIDFGTQETTWEGKTKIQHKMGFTFEFPTKKAVFSEEAGEQPFVKSKEMSFSITDSKAAIQSTLKMLINATREKDLTDDEVKEGFNIFSLIGAVCMAQVQENSKGNQAIKSFSKVPDEIDIKDKKFAPINEPVWYYIPEHNQELFDTFPDFIKEKITSSPEYAKYVKGSDKVAENSLDQIPF